MRKAVQGTVANILVVDDDERLLNRMVQEFSAFGHACHAQTSGEGALTQVAQAPYDLMVLDVMLPGISGFEVCRRIRSNEQYYGMPILLLSAMNDEEEISHGLAQGADDFLTKPFRFDMLLRRVEGLLHAQVQSPPTDAATSLLSAKGIKLEVQRAINTRQQFQVVYVELLNITEFGRLVREEDRVRALRHVSKALQAYGDKIQGSPFFLGHLGGGHFLGILPKGIAEEYCGAVARLWREHLPEFYAAIGKANAYAAAKAGGTRPQQAMPLLDVSFFIASHDGATNRTFREVFETLSRLRESSRSRGAGIYVDRRCE